MVTIEGPFRPKHDGVQPHSKPELSQGGRGEPGWIPTVAWWSDGGWDHSDFRQVPRPPVTPD